MSARHKVSVGIDYGTTFSGIAFVTSQRSDVKDIEVVNDWPDGARATEYLEKVPSQIAYARDNIKHNLDDDRWGYGVEPGMLSYCWTKLLLDARTAATNYDDPSLKEAAGGAGLRVPPGKSPVDVVTDYLKHLYKHCMDRLERKLTKGLLDASPIEFWFTMPAIWSDEAQFLTRKAAKDAGFGTRPLDSINMITEPEAAALAAFKTTKDKFDDLLVANTGVLICDCGGGTVDINTYTITTSGLDLKLEEACVGDGGKCGATYVDRSLHDLLIRRYGDAFSSLPIAKRGPGSRFMSEFEAAKKDFGSAGPRTTNLRLIMKDIKEGDWNCVQYDPEEGEVEITHEDMKSCFDPVVDTIIEMVAKQVQDVVEDGSPPVENIILVGGFGSSPYLWKRIKEWCDEHGRIRPISPERPWSAIARGAALRGLEGTIIGSKRCRRHYGTVVARPFRPGVDPFDRHVFTDPISGQCRGGWMTWQIKKGEKIYQKTKRSLPIHQTFRKGDGKSTCMKLYASAFDTAPDRREDRGLLEVGTIEINMYNIDFSKFTKKKDGHLWWKKTWIDVDYNVEVAMGDESGLLQFRVMCKGRQVGTASIDFTKE